MKTETYNPSPLEVEMADILENLRETINDQLKDNTIIEVDKNTFLDNPIVRIKTEDKDGDQHQLILRIIQKPDAMV